MSHGPGARLRILGEWDNQEPDVEQFTARIDVQNLDTKSATAGTADAAVGASIDAVFNAIAEQQAEKFPLG